eukprot:14925535-Alexandrium_andersonii.AAC.1
MSASLVATVSHSTCASLGLRAGCQRRLAVCCSPARPPPSRPRPPCRPAAASSCAPAAPLLRLQPVLPMAPG